MPDTTTLSTYQPLINREYKSTVFATYFSTPEHAASLYRSLSDDESIQPEDIEFVTLEGAIYLNRKNDFAFTSRGKVLIIGEHQSTLNPNMPLRMERLLPANMIYKASLIKIPTPEFYVFYNGTKTQPKEHILKLSDAYIEKTAEPMLDLTVKMININLVTNHPILQKSQSMYEYAAFIQKVKDYKEPEQSLEKAIKAAIYDCLMEGIMTDFLQKHGSEVVNMLFAEFNMEEALKVRGEEQYEIGRTEGKAEGRAEGKAEGRAEGKASEIRLIRNILQKELSVSEIAVLLGISESYILKIVSMIAEHPEESDVKIAERCLYSESV